MTEKTIKDLASTFHVWDPELQANPYPALERLRLQCPVAHSEMFGGYWLLTRYSDIRTILSDASLWSSSVPALPAPPMEHSLNYIPVGVDPPAHTAYRRILGPIFSPARVEALEPEFRSRMRGYIQDIRASDGPVDFLKVLAVPFPCYTILRTFGLPEEDFDLLFDFKVKLFDEQYSPDPEVTRRFAEVTTPVIRDYFGRQIEERRGPGAPDDALTAIVNAKFNGERDLTHDEIVSIATLVLSAGLDTVTAELAFFMDFFARNPDRWQEIIDHPQRIPGAVEELLRVNSIVTLHRHATRDTEVNGHAFTAGEFVQLSLPAAAFDPQEFPDPHTVDFQRTPNRHLTFGGGPHRCFGSNLARAELRIALEELSQAFSSVSYPAGYVPPRNFGLVMNMLDQQLLFS
jgi:cytochrome P450